MEHYQWLGFCARQNRVRSIDPPIAAAQSGLQKGQTLFRAAGSKQLDCIAQHASTRRFKENDGLAGQIMNIKKGIDGLGYSISPYGEAPINCVVGESFIACGIILVVLKLLPKFVRVNTLKKLEVKFIHRAETLEFLNKAIEDLGCTIIDVDFHAEMRPTGNLYTNVADFSGVDNGSFFVPSLLTLSRSFASLTF